MTKKAFNKIWDSVYIFLATFLPIRGMKLFIELVISKKFASNFYCDKKFCMGFYTFRVSEIMLPNVENPPYFFGRGESSKTKSLVFILT